MAEKRLMLGWLHLTLTVLSGGVLLTLVLLLAVGKVEIRPVTPAPNEPSPPDGSSHGPRIEPVANEFLDMLGHKAKCFVYRGCWIDCWIEVEVDGHKTR